MAGELVGKVALVTGGGRGIGRAIALKYAEAGAAVGVTARSAAELDETARLIRDQGGRVLALAGDVSSPADVTRVCDAVERDLGPISLLMNNAGNTGPFGPAWEVDADAWWQTQEIHLRGSFMYAHRLIPGMIERGGGRVIFMASGAGTRINPNYSSYSVAKAAMIRLAETIAAEGREHGLICFPMSPGLVITELAEVVLRNADAHRWNSGFVERLTNEKAAGRFNDSMAKVTDLALLLASGEADALSGKHLTPADDVRAMIKEARASA